jgi:Helix-turn-helix of DDE superfamily endonuclease
MRYADVSRKEKKCLDFTSLTVEEFEELTPVFEEEFQKYMKTHRLDGKDRVGRKYQTYSNCPLPTPEDRLFFLLVYLKTNNLQGIHGELFGMSQGKANQWIHTLLPVLQATGRRLGDAPARSLQELACRLGQAVSPEISSITADDIIVAFEELPDISDSSPIALDMPQDQRIFAHSASNDASFGCEPLIQEICEPVSPPLFAMTEPKDVSNGQKTTRNRKSIIVERKRLTR